jgi:hypothetical protein
MHLRSCSTKVARSALLQIKVADSNESGPTKSYLPMEALPVAGPQWQYEPKWDGFRCLAVRDGKRVDLMSSPPRR